MLKPLGVQFKTCGPGTCAQPKGTVLTQQFTAERLALMGSFVIGKPVFHQFIAIIFDKCLHPHEPFWGGLSAPIPVPSIQDRGEVL